MGYIRTTNEYINSPADVWQSLDKHLGIEYSDEVKQVLFSEQGEFITREEHEEEMNNWEEDYKHQKKYTDRLTSVIETNYQGVNDIIDFVLQTKRLNRQELVKQLKNIKNDLGGFCRD